MKIVGLIQARMGSSRLPGKVMMPLSGKPLIWHIIQRLKSVLDKENIIIATTQDHLNDQLDIVSQEEAVKIYRHDDEDDIVGRLYNSIKMTNADAILKVNADCPLVDPAHMQKLIDILITASEDIEVVCNKIERTYPLGYSLELIKASAINWCQDNLKSYDDRELVIKWILDNPDKFKSISVINEIDYGNMNLTVDTREDYQLMEKIFNALFPSNPVFGMSETIEFLKSNAR